MMVKRAFTNKQKQAMYAQGVNFCACCGKIKPLSEFPKSRNALSGHSSRCKECSRVANAKSRDKRDAARSGKGESSIFGRRVRIDGRIMRTAKVALSQIVEYVDVSNRGCQTMSVTGLEQYSDTELLQELARRGYALKNFSKVRVELHYSPVVENE